MYDTTITTTADVATRLHRDRERGHQATLQLWDFPRGTHAPRAQVQALWTVLSADAITGQGTLLLRSAEPPTCTPSWVQKLDTVEHQHTPTVGETVQLTTELECSKTPHTPVPREVGQRVKRDTGRAFRAARVPVPEDEQRQWAVAKLERHGVAVDVVENLRCESVWLSRRRMHYDTVVLCVSGTVADAGTYQAAMSGGVGKLKPFGGGLLRQVR